MISLRLFKGADGKPPRRFLRWILLALLIAGLLWLVSWLVQRSYRSPRRQRALQSWLDDTLNADVSLLGGMTVRVNIVRDSRLVLRKVEIDHPNALFSGKFVTADEATAWASTPSLLNLWSDDLELQFKGVGIGLVENEFGEWSIAGFMDPFEAANAGFPFPVPKFRRWTADIENSALAYRRRDYELRIGIEAEAIGDVGSGRVTVKAKKAPLEFGRAGAEDRLSGTLGPASVTATVAKPPGGPPTVALERCEIRVDKLPVSVLPMFLPGIPLENTQGAFNGLVQIHLDRQGAGQFSMEGEITDVPLSVFGLPPRAALKASYPLVDGANGAEALAHIGPSGFGGIEMRIPLDSTGRPQRLVMQGDVAALDDLPVMLSRHVEWPEWLSRTFPTLEWRAASWLGFGWSGKNLSLTLSRAAGGMSLFGEAEMMGGRARLALNPGTAESYINVAAERVDPQLLAVKLSQMVPEAFRAQLTGLHANLTWRGVHPAPGDLEVRDWGAGIVFSRPSVEVQSSGEWWRRLARLPSVVAGELAKWGGGESFQLDKMAARLAVGMEQFSVILDQEPGGTFRVEYNGFGQELGELVGYIEKRPGQPAAGDLYLNGRSTMLTLAREANPRLGEALARLADEEVGIRVSYVMDERGGLTFSYPFLEDLERIRLEAEPAAAPGAAP